MGKRVTFLCARSGTRAAPLPLGLEDTNACLLEQCVFSGLFRPSVDPVRTGRPAVSLLGRVDHLLYIRSTTTSTQPTTPCMDTLVTIAWKFCIYQAVVQDLR